MRAFVGVTDGDWFRFLRARPELDEVNFWQPSGHGGFHAILLGEPFLFKLHSPENYIVGGGFFAHFSLLPSKLAWASFGEKNGAATYDDMRRRIAKYRRFASTPRGDYTIGCILLIRPFFFDRADWIPVPADFKKNIVRGKGYDLIVGPGRELWQAVQNRLKAARLPGEAAEPKPQEMWGDPVLVRQRLGQGTFRVMVTDAYERRCAMTREKVLPVLEAAHIRPVSAGGMHRVDNGLLLRADVHTLFDDGYVTVTPELKVRVSRRLKDDWDNGEQYFQYEGSKLWVPRAIDDRPKREFLEWHADTVFVGQGGTDALALLTGGLDVDGEFGSGWAQNGVAIVLPKASPAGIFKRQRTAPDAGVV